MALPADLPQPSGDPATLAERRARRAELAEAELRSRLEAATAQVAALEHAERERQIALERLAARARRDERLADVVGAAATAMRDVRSALDREIARRAAAEAALTAERRAREAAEMTVVAERAARDAAVDALAAERAHRPAPPVAPAAPALPLPPAPPQHGASPETDQLIAGLALAAERLRAQTAEPAGPEPAAPAPAPFMPPAPAPVRRSGGLLSRLERALRNAR